MFDLNANSGGFTFKYKYLRKSMSEKNIVTYDNLIKKLRKFKKQSISIFYSPLAVCDFLAVLLAIKKYQE